MDEAESVLSSRSASPYSQIHVGNSSPSAVAEVQNDKPISSSHQVTQSKTTYQNAISNRPIAPPAPKSIPPATEYNRENINSTQSQILRQDQQRAYSSASQVDIPTTYTHIPATANNIKPNDLNLFAANTTAYTVPNFTDSSVAVFHIPSHLATAMSTGGIHANDDLNMGNAHPLSSVGHLTNTWHSSSGVPLLDADLFNNSKHGVFNTNPNTVGQRTVSFAGGGYATGSLGQSVE